MGHQSKPTSLLSAEWINERAKNVERDALEILDQILEGLLSSEYLPFSRPATPEMVRRMTDEQLGEALLANIETGGAVKLMQMAGEEGMMSGGEMV